MYLVELKIKLFTTLLFSISPLVLKGRVKDNEVKVKNWDIYEYQFNMK